MKSGWACCFACLALLCACIPPRLTPGDAAAPLDTATAPDMAQERITTPLSLRVTADENDAVWIDGMDERLHYSSTNPTLEVGTDAEIGRTGLRFQVPVPAHVMITSAKLGLRRHSGKLDLASHMTVQIYDSVDVPPFSDLHEHTPDKHDARGLWGSTIDGFMVCEAGQVCTSPDLSKLVQRIVDRAEWTGTGWMGFVLAPDDDFTPDGWIAFEDSFAATDAPSLEIVYVAPPP